MGFAIRICFVVFLALAGLSSAGCGASPLAAATNAANSARELEVTAGEVLRIRCTEAYKRAMAVDVAALDRGCIPARKAYGTLRSARLVTIAAIVAYQVRQDPLALTSAAATLGAASVELARAVASLPGE